MSAAALSPAWTGAFAEREVGIRVHTDAARSLVPVDLLVGVALRRNPRRAQLLVSTVLAKHVPTDPGLVIVAAELLGLLVAGELDGRRPDPALFARLARILKPAAAADAPGAADAADAAGAAARAPGAADAAADTSADLAPLRAEVAALRTAHPDVVTLGYAETATGLGQLVAQAIGSYAIHSTRHAPDGMPAFAGFEEEHSHATSHQLYPADPGWLRPDGTVVLVDDELSTGTTIVNTIRALHRVAPQSRWVVAALIDLRSPDDRRRFDDLAAELGTRVAVVSLGAGSIDLPQDVLSRAARALAATAPPRGPEPHVSAARVADCVLSRGAVVEQGATSAVGGAGGAGGAGGESGTGDVSVLTVAVGALPSARFGVDARRASAAGIAEARAAEHVAATIAPLVGGGETLVLGSEEFIAFPLAVADRLAEHPPTAAPTAATAGLAATTPPATATSTTGAGTQAGIGSAAARRVSFSTTTRSPIAPLDRADYAIASAITFRSHDVTHDGPGPRFAYNLTRGGRRFDRIVFLPEPGADRERMLAPDGVVEALRGVTDHVIVVTLDTTPESGP